MPVLSVPRAPRDETMLLVPRSSSPCRQPPPKGQLWSSAIPKTGPPCYARCGARRKRGLVADGVLDFPGSALRSATTTRPPASHDGEAFLFCCTGGELVVRREETVETQRDDASDDQECQLTSDALHLPPFELRHAAGLLPAFQAVATANLGLVDPVALCCLPIITPFSMPAMAPSAWFSNKKALAYNRVVILTVYAQGAFAILKFMSGNMVGGFFDGVQAGMGFYSLLPDGMRTFPTYMMMAGFNGIIGLLQVLQTYNGVPIHFLPVMQVVPPIVAIASAYFGWQFCVEVRKIASGIPEDASPSCFVRMLGSDWWPSCLSAPLYGNGPDGSEREEGGFGGFGSRASQQQRFAVFEGNGHRLGGT